MDSSRIHLDFLVWGGSKPLPWVILVEPCTNKSGAGDKIPQPSCLLVSSLAEDCTWVRLVRVPFPKSIKFGSDWPLHDKWGRVAVCLLFLWVAEGLSLGWQEAFPLKFCFVWWVAIAFPWGGLKPLPCFASIGGLWFSFGVQFCAHPLFMYHANPTHIFWIERKTNFDPWDSRNYSLWEGIPWVSVREYERERFQKRMIIHYKDRNSFGDSLDRIPYIG